MKKSQILVLVLFTLVVLGAGIFLGRVIFVNDTTPQSGSSDFKLITEAWDITRQVYVDKPATDAQTMAYASISGMVESLGDTGHSRFLTPEDVKQLQNQQKGQLEGIGVIVQLKNGQVTMVSVISGSPAQKAGLLPGDIITQVDGKPVQGLDDAVQKIIGPAGTSVTLTIISASTGQTIDITIVRARIDIKSVTWSLLPGTSIAHIYIASFSSGTTKELADALTAIQQQNATGIILDLRDDPGGILDEAIGVASEFMNTGNVLMEKNAKGDINPVPVKPEGVVVADTPMVVLINGGTASAAEIVSGALQDNGRAVLIGQTTFGTGTVLGEFSLSDGSAVLLAIQEWLTPKGRTIWHQGLTPDTEVALPQGVAPLFPEQEAGMTAEQLQNSGDQQLLQAISALSK